MAQIVVPFRGENGKQRLDTSDDVRSQLALAMLGDVLAAATVAGRTLVVTDDKAGRALAAELGAEPVARSRPAGREPRSRPRSSGWRRAPVLVVNADLPCVVPHDLRTLAGAAELGAIGYVEAEDGTTNALALPRDGALRAALRRAAAPPASATTPTASASPAVACAIPNLATTSTRSTTSIGSASRAGPRTQAAIGRALQR